MHVAVVYIYTYTLQTRFAGVGHALYDSSYGDVVCVTVVPFGHVLCDCRYWDVLYVTFLPVACSL